jgi:hypothetical protein
LLETNCCFITRFRRQKLRKFGERVRERERGEEREREIGKKCGGKRKIIREEGRGKE